MKKKKNIKKSKYNKTITHSKTIPHSVDYEENSIIDSKTEVICDDTGSDIKLSHYLEVWNLRLFNNKKDMRGRRPGDGCTDFLEY